MEKLMLTILETSDVHGNILPINYGNNDNADVGLAKIAALIKKERKNNEYVLTVDNGDIIQGTPLTYHYVKKMANKVNPMIEVLNHLEYDAAVVGNHEFNYGMRILHKAAEDSKFPWLSANILSEEGQPFLGKPYIIKNFGDVKAAVLGVTTHYIPNWEDPSHIEGLSFRDAREATREWVEHIHKEESPDLLIVSYHGGFESDLTDGRPTENLTGENQAYAICDSIAGIDVLLTGHQHRMIAGEKINNTLVVQPGVNGQSLGKVTISLEKNQSGWKVVDKNATLLLTGDVDPDHEIINLIKEYENATQRWLDTPMGRINGDMTVSNAVDIRTQDNPLIEFINRVQMAVSGAEISNTALFHNESPGFPKQVTMRDIVSNYIYPNTLKVIRITGKDMKDALERSASYFMVDSEGELAVNPTFTTPKPQHYNYDMWEGIDYLLDVRKPIGSRVVKLERNGSPVNMEAEYDVVMNNYRAGGGGDYTMYHNKPVIKDIPMDMSELIATYILEKKLIEPTVNNNWKVIWKEGQEA
jgi:2',3'-cyclic-nucleotide 2'-phosphodiesterase/3'-nucleotidase